MNDISGLSALDRRNTDGFLKLLVFLIGFGTFLDGYDLLNISNALPFLKYSIALTSMQIGLIGDITYIGGIAGAALFGLLGDRAGKKFIFMVDLFFFILGALLSSFVTNAAELLALRFIIGVGIGADIVSAPIILADISPSMNRGLLLGLSCTMMAVGGLTSVGLSYLLVISHVSPLIIWRVILGAGAVPAIIILALRTKVPESPRWLLSKEKFTEYRKVMSKLLKINESEVMTTRSRASGISSLFTGYRREVAYTAIAWLAAGTTSIFTIFTPTILSSLHMGSYTMSLEFTGIMWSSALAGSLLVSLLQDVVGRRPFFFASISMMGAADLITGFLYKALPPLSLAILFSVIFFSGFMNIGIAYTLQSEVFPPEIKSTGSGFSFSLNRLDNFFFGVFTPIALAAGILGHYIASVGIFIVTLLLVSIFVSKETRNKSLEEISCAPKVDVNY
ncbi:MAG: MFS transporter [Conexivisphaerales archaeon]